MADAPSAKKPRTETEPNRSDTDDVESMLNRPYLSMSEMNLALNCKPLVGKWWSDIVDVRVALAGQKPLGFTKSDKGWAHAFCFKRFVSAIANAGKNHCAVTLPYFKDPSTICPKQLNGWSYPSIVNFYKQFNQAAPRAPQYSFHCVLTQDIAVLETMGELPSGSLELTGNPNLFSAMLLGQRNAHKRNLYSAAWTSANRSILVTVWAKRDVLDMGVMNFQSSLDLQALDEHGTMSALDQVDVALDARRALDIRHAPAACTQEKWQTISKDFDLIHQTQI